MDLLQAPAEHAWLDLLTAASLSGAAAYLCIHCFIALVERTGMLPYVLYRLALGCGLFVFLI